MYGFSILSSGERRLYVQYVNLEILYYIRVRNASLFDLPIKEKIKTNYKSANRPIYYWIFFKVPSRLIILIFLDIFLYFFILVIRILFSS